MIDKHKSEDTRARATDPAYLHVVFEDLCENWEDCREMTSPRTEVGLRSLEVGKKVLFSLVHLGPGVQQLGCRDRDELVN